MTSEQGNRYDNTRTIVALVGCAVGVGLMVFGFGISSSSKERPAPPAKQESTKKLPAWNIALGDLVIVAQDMGFSVKSVKDAAMDSTKIAGRIESQLQSLRELFRQEGSTNAALMGGIVLQLDVGSSGEVSKVREIASRISDGEFRKAVIAEASTWSFDQVITEEATIICPLLFVREGMDVTTLIQWEKNLIQPGDKTALSKINISPDPAPQAKTAKNSQPHKLPAKEVAATSQEKLPGQKVQPVAESALYQLKYTTAIRKEPNFSATAVARFTTGTRVILLGKAGDWYEVRYEGGPRGFLRREFVTPVDAAKESS